MKEFKLSHVYVVVSQRASQKIWKASRVQSHGCEASQVEARAIDVSAMLEEMASRLAKDLYDASPQAKTLEHRLVSKTDEQLLQSLGHGKAGRA